MTVRELIFNAQKYYPATPTGNYILLPKGVTVPLVATDGKTIYKSNYTYGYSSGYIGSNDNEVKVPILGQIQIETKMLYITSSFNRNYDGDSPSDNEAEFSYRQCMLSADDVKQYVHFK